MTAFTASIELPAPPATVWSVVLNPHRLQDWVTIHRQLLSADDGPARTGFRMTQQMAIRGAPVKVRWVLERCEEPRYAQWSGRGPAGSTASIEYRLTPVPNGTRFAYTNDFAPPMGPLGRIASSALMGGTPEREAEASLQRLHDLLTRPT